MNSESPRKPPIDFLRQFAMAMNLPFVLVGGVVIGGGFGWLLDRWLHSAPWMMLVFGLLGFAGGVRDILRRINRAEKQGEKGDDDG
jgi:ATP synthase protein I